jgi:hypothetical protein
MRHLALLLPYALLAAAASTQADDPKPAASKVKPKPADGDAPLAEGFPNSTEPGKIEVKKYPAYRSAVTKADKATVSSGDLMFFALFNPTLVNVALRAVLSREHSRALLGLNSGDTEMGPCR